MVVNNPESNMGNAIGICPVLQLYKRGILLGMGTDAYTNDMLESLKVALCSQRSQNCLPNVGWCEVTDMLFKNNAKIGARYFPDELGVLKAGAAADIIVMDYKPFTPFSDENIDGHMIFGMTGRQCQTTIAAGKTAHAGSSACGHRRRGGKRPHSGSRQEAVGRPEPQSVLKN